MDDLYQKLLTAYESRESTLEDMARQRDEFVAEIVELKRELRRRDEMLTELMDKLIKIEKEGIR